GGAAAADLPPLAAPGGRGLLQVLALEGLRRVARHRVEAPDLAPALRVVGRHVAAYAELGAAVADDDVALHDARRAGDRVGARGVRRLHRPDQRAGGGVERDQAAVERAAVDAALVDRDAAVHDVAAGVRADALRHLRIVRPDELAGARVDGVDEAPRP